MADRSKQRSIFHLKRADEAEYGDYIEHIIIAESEQEARLIAGRVCRKNGIIWVDPACTTCVLIGTTKLVDESSIVMSEMLGE